MTKQLLSPHKILASLLMAMCVGIATFNFIQMLKLEMPANNMLEDFSFDDDGTRIDERGDFEFEDSLDDRRDFSFDDGDNENYEEEGEENKRHTPTGNSHPSHPITIIEDKNESQGNKEVDTIKDTDTPHLNIVQQKNTSIVKLPTMPNDREILYVHVSKTGGLTLDRVLRSNCVWHHKSRRDMCLRKLHFSSVHRDANDTRIVTFGRNESALSHLTKFTMHLSKKDDIVQFAKHDATSFLFTVRNPVDRTVSAFNMIHIKNQPIKNKGKSNNTMQARKIFYGECFPTVEDLANVLTNQLKHGKTKYIQMPTLNDPNVTETVNCYELAQGALRGGKNHAKNIHLFKNYKFYEDVSTKMNPKKEVLVIRTEHLWDDLEVLNLALTNALVKHGAVYNATQNETASSSLPPSSSISSLAEIRGHAFTHGSEKKNVTSGLSREGRQIVCCYLSEDNQIFEGIVRDALNLDEMEKRTYLDGLYGDCGITEDEREQGGEEVFSWVEWANGKGCL